MNEPTSRYSPEWWSELVREPIEIHLWVTDPGLVEQQARNINRVAAQAAMTRRAEQMQALADWGLPLPDETTFGGYGSPGKGTVRVLKYDKTCDECKGTGQHEWTDGGGWTFVDTCPYCRGEGWREPGVLKPVDEAGYEPPLYLLLGIGNDGKNYGGEG